MEYNHGLEAGVSAVWLSFRRRTPMDEDEPNLLARFNYLAGQVHALKCVMASFATILSLHPKAREEFEAATQVGLGKLETTRSSDHAIDGFQSIVEPLRRKIEGRGE